MNPGQHEDAGGEEYCNHRKAFRDGERNPGARFLAPEAQQVKDIGPCHDE